MIQLLRRIITYPRRKRERERQRLTTLREREAFDARDHQNVRISQKVGDGEFVVIRDFDVT